MPALEDVGLVAAQGAVGLVSLGDEFLDLGGGGTAVVRGEQDQGVPLESVLLQGLEDLEHVGVHLLHEVGIGIDAAAALPLLGRNDRSVRRGEGDVGEEGFAGLGVLRPLTDVTDEPGGDAGLYVDGVEVRARGTGAQPGLGGGGGLGGATSLDPDEGRHVQGGADAEELIESAVERSALHLARPVDFVGVGRRFGEIAAVVGITAALQGPADAEMPLAEHGGAIAGRLQKVGDGLPLRSDQGRGEAAEDAVLQAGAPVIASG